MSDKKNRKLLIIFLPITAIYVNAIKKIKGRESESDENLKGQKTANFSLLSAITFTVFEA
jgi:hypothetical protein